MGYVALACASLCVVVLVWYLRDSSKVDDLDTRYVFITGCDSGFGHLLATQLDGQHFNVIAACLTERGASELSSMASRRLKTVLLDVTDDDAIRRAVEVVSAEVGERGLWGLVNNAGRATPLGPVDWLLPEDFSETLAVNLMGVVGVTLRLLPLLKKGGGGRVVNMASVLGRLALISGGYCISKSAVESFSDSLRIEMRHFGIKVSIVEPGFFKTPMTRTDLMEKNMKDLWDRLPQDVRDSYGTNYLEEYLKSLVFFSTICCSDLSKVTSCMEHALTARYPRARYSAGWDAKLLWIPLSYCPTRVTDFFCGLLYPKPKAV